MNIYEMKTENAVDMLRMVKIFTYLNRAELEELLSLGTIKEYEEGERIVKEGSTSTHLYAILSGFTNIQVSEPSGNEVYVSAIGEGEIIGEAALFMNVRRTANVVASGNTILFEMPRESFLKFIGGKPKSGMKVLMLIVYSLLKKLRESNHELAFERNTTNIEQDDIDSIISDFMQ